MIFTIPFSPDANMVGLNSHSVKLSPAAVANEFAKKFRRVNIWASSRLSKRESKCLYTRVEEFNFECSVFHWPLLPYQLIKPMTLNRARTIAVGIDSVIISRRRAIQHHLEANRPSIFGGTQH